MGRIWVLILPHEWTMHYAGPLAVPLFPPDIPWEGFFHGPSTGLLLGHVPGHRPGAASSYVGQAAFRAWPAV